MASRTRRSGRPATRPIQAGALAIPYERFSERRQGQGDSIRRQSEKAREFIERYKLKLYDVPYRDEGVSAFDRSNVTRGKLKAFLDAVEGGQIPAGSYLLVENLDRVSRANAMEAVALLDRIVKLGIRLVTLTDGAVFDEESITDPHRIILAVLAFVRANEESESKSERVWEANEKKRSERDPMAFSNAPGWLKKKADRTGWEVIEERAKSVVKVFELYAKGYGSVYIARLANKEGWPVPGKAEAWHKTLPQKLIYNRRVLGELSPAIVVDGQRVPTGEVWKDYYPRIVSDEMFYAAAAAAESRRNRPKRRDLDYHNVFQGLLHCGHCGGTFSRKRKHGGKKNSPGYAQYVCSNRDRGVTGCPNWNAKEMEEVLIPTAMTFVAKMVVAGSAQKKARNEFALAKAALSSAERRLKNSYGLIENWDGDRPWQEEMPHTATQIRALEAEVKTGKECVVPGDTQHQTSMGEFFGGVDPPLRWPLALLNVRIFDCRGVTDQDQVGSGEHSRFELSLYRNFGAQVGGLRSAPNHQGDSKVGEQQVVVPGLKEQVFKLSSTPNVPLADPLFPAPLRDLVSRRLRKIARGSEDQSI